MKSMKVLLVEDLLLAGKIARCILGDHCDVDLASTAEEAMTKVKTKVYDLIFMDLDLPDTHGIEVSKKMRNNAIKTPIYALTAHTDRETREEALAAGMTGFLAKPLEKLQVQALLIKHADG
jgi:CheY-like chemotaxis protein